MLNLGDKVKDRLSDLTGIVTGRTVYLFGCVHILVNPGVIKDGAPVESTWLDEDRLELVARAVVVASPQAIASHAGSDSNQNISR